MTDNQKGLITLAILLVALYFAAKLAWFLMPLALFVAAATWVWIKWGKAWWASKG